MSVDILNKQIARNLHKQDKARKAIKIVLLRINIVLTKFDLHDSDHSGRVYEEYLYKRRYLYRHHI